jgi:hypothetical protein
MSCSRCRVTQKDVSLEDGPTFFRIGNNISLVKSIQGYVMQRPSSEEIRIRQLYRSLILLGKARISLESARGLVGQDSAYHLYTRHKSKFSRRRK